jgi:hypothetical protein
VLRLPRVAEADVVAVLKAAHRRGPATLLYEAAHEAGLGREELFARASATFLGFCAGNLCDDLIDGDCTYLSPAVRCGPGVQCLLQQLWASRLLAAGVPPAAVEWAFSELAIAAAYEQLEAHTTRWDAATYREIGEGSAGRQWAADLRLLWAGTRLETSAATCGRDAAVLGHVHEDRTSDDGRFTSLSEDDRAEVLAWAAEAADRLASRGLRFTSLVLAAVAPTVAAAHGSRRGASSPTIAGP